MPRQPRSDVPRASGHARDTAAGAPLPIGAVVEVTGLTARTVRYYEQMGLLSPAARSSGRQRRYDPSDLERLHTIRDLGEAGFSLAEIAELLEDEAARERGRAAFYATDDAQVRMAILEAAQARYKRRIEGLDARIARLAALRREAIHRLALVRERLATEQHARDEASAETAVPA